MTRFAHLVLVLCVIALAQGTWTLAHDAGYESGLRAARAEVRLDFAQCDRALANADEATIAAEREGTRKFTEAAQLVQQFADEAKHAEEALASCRAGTQSICQSNPASTLIPPAPIARARDPPVAKQRVWD